MCVHPPRIVITSSVIVIWTPNDWLTKFYSVYMAAIVGIVSRHDLTIKTHRSNQPNKSKLALYKSLLHVYNDLKQLYMSYKTERFSYKGGCGIREHSRTETSKTRADLGYR